MSVLEFEDGYLSLQEHSRSKEDSYLPLNWKAQEHSPSTAHDDDTYQEVIGKIFCYYYFYVYNKCCPSGSFKTLAWVC